MNADGHLVEQVNNRWMPCDVSTATTTRLTQ